MYKVIRDDGAKIRATMELDSEEVGLCPLGAG